MIAGIADAGMILLDRFLQESHGYLLDGGTLELNYYISPQFLKKVYENGWKIMLVEQAKTSQEIFKKNTRFPYVRLVLKEQTQDEFKGDGFKEFMYYLSELVDLEKIFEMGKLSEDLLDRISSKKHRIDPFLNPSQDARELIFENYLYRIAAASYWGLHYKATSDLIIDGVHLKTKEDLIASIPQHPEVIRMHRERSASSFDVSQGGIDYRDLEIVSDSSVQIISDDDSSASSFDDGVTLRIKDISPINYIDDFLGLE